MVCSGLLASAWRRPRHHSCLHQKPHIFLSITLLFERPHLILQDECAKEPSNQLLGNRRYHFQLFGCQGSLRAHSSSAGRWSGFSFLEKSSDPSQCLWSSAELLDWKGSVNIPRRPCSFMSFLLVSWHVPRFSSETFLTFMVNQTDSR